MNISNQEGAKPDLREKLILREFDDNVAWMRALFQNFLSWYTFFVTANLFALSWIFTDKLKREGLWPLVILFIVLNVCGIATAALLAKYIAKAEGRNVELVQRLNTLAKLIGEEAMRPTFPVSLARAGFIFMSIGLLVIAVLWVVAAI